MIGIFTISFGISYIDGVKGNLCGTIYDSTLPYQPGIKKGRDNYITINNNEYKVIGITSRPQERNNIYTLQGFH